ARGRAGPRVALRFGKPAGAGSCAATPHPPPLQGLREGPQGPFRTSGQVSPPPRITRNESGSYVVPTFPGRAGCPPWTVGGCAPGGADVVDPVPCGAIPAPWYV